MTTPPENEFVCSECGTAVRPDQQVCPSCGTPLDPPPAGLVLYPMQLGDIFSHTFRIIGKTATRYLTIAALFYIPAGVIFTVAAHWFYSQLGGKILHPYTESSMLDAGLLFGFSIVILMLATLGANIAVTSMVEAEMNGMTMSWKTAFHRAMSYRFWRGLLFFLLVGLAMMGIMLVFVLILTAASSIPLLVLPFAVGMACAIIYLGIRWFVGLPAIVIEDATPTEALGRSSGLVRDDWWRVFGIVLLMGILTGFAVTIVSAPVSLIALWGFYREYFAALGATGGSPDPETIARGLSSMGTGIGISASLQFILSGLVTPIYTTILYYDLRSRQGDFLPPPSEAPLGESGAPTQTA